MYTPDQVESIRAAITQGAPVLCSPKDIRAAQECLDAYAATLRQAPAQGGVTEAFNWTEFWNRISQSFGSKDVDEVYACYEAGKRAALSAQQQGEDEQVPATAAPKVIAEFLRFVGLLLDSVKQSKTNPNASFVDWRDVCAMKGDLPYVRAALATLTAPPAQPADSKVIGADSKVKPERVPVGTVRVADNPLSKVALVNWRPGFVPTDGLRLFAQPAERVPEEATDEFVPRWWDDSHGDAYKEGWNACRVAMLAATPAAPAEEGDGKEVSRG